MKFYKNVRFLVLFLFSKHNKPHFANSEFTKWGINRVFPLVEFWPLEQHTYRRNTMRIPYLGIEGTAL